MERCVLFLTATAFIAVGANIVIQIDFKRPTFITYNDRSEVIEDGDAEVTCIPADLCRTDIQENRIIVQTVPEVMRDLIETATVFEDEPDRLQQAASSELTTMTPWKVYVDEVKSKRKNRKKKQRKLKTTTTTTTTTEEPWFEATTIDLYDFASEEVKDYSETHRVDSMEIESAEKHDSESTMGDLYEETTSPPSGGSWWG